MITPADAIAELDRALADAGETVTLRRYTAPTGSPRPKTEVVDVPAAIRALKADEIVGAVKQNSLKVVLSPTLISTLIPLRTGDKVLVAGAEKNVEFASHIRVQDVLVRVELTVLG